MLALNRNASFHFRNLLITNYFWLKKVTFLFNGKVTFQKNAYNPINIYFY
jgi:hypothetical protein